LIWWIHQPGRALSEKADIAALEKRVSWLRVKSWQPPDITSLSVEMEIEVGERLIPLTLIYPELFPDFPARIVPTDGVRLSGHQYGAKGELCLEWRPDNWQPDVTGVMLIESAYKLLSTEDETDEAAESAHDLTLGQEVRQKVYRLLLSEACRRALFALPEGCQVGVKTAERYFVKTWVSEITSIGEGDRPAWEAMPTTKFGNTTHEGIVIRKSVPLGFPDKAAAKEFLGEMLSEWLDAHPGKDPILIFVADDKIKMFELIETLDNLLSYETIPLPADHVRLPMTHAELSKMKVGIVGCGSVGSKIAASLARSGVGNFVLVDSDILFAGNVVRNELDLRAVGVNKTKGVERAIVDINASASVDVSDALLGRQESGAWSADAAMKLAKCDLLIDATADISAFTACAAIAQAYKKPLIWGRVYEGGLGGLIARARPDLDPVPQAARRQIDGWFRRNDIPWHSNDETRNYGGGDDGNPVVASDAEVGVIAMHMVRFAIDALVRPNATEFPCSVYAVGFSAKWMFTQPLELWPIHLLQEGAWGATQEDDRDQKLKELVAQLFPETDGQSED
jgi:molybdopterin/thiamine biosynthesis adenylyltransferase